MPLHKLDSPILQKRIHLSLGLLAVLFASNAFGQTDSDRLEIPRDVKAVLQDSCLDCHRGESAENDLRLDNIADLSLPERLDLLNRAQDQLFFGLMPPGDSDQPDKQAKASLATWLRSELRQHGASKLDEKLRHEAFGNYVDHEKLFSGEIQDKAFTPARHWLVLSLIHI